MTEVKAQENGREEKRDPYRALSVSERDLLFAFYEKHNGNVLAMVRDAECTFKGRNQIYYYRDLYGFREELVQSRAKRAKQVTEMLGDAKVRAVENAMRMLEPRHMLLLKKDGTQMFDSDGNPKLLEMLPNHTELRAAYEIIKTELGEPSSIGKTDITSKGEKITAIEVEVIRPKYDKPEGEKTEA